MDDRERLLACLAVKGGFISAPTARLGVGQGPGLLGHLERAGALTALQGELLTAFAAQAIASHGDAGAAVRALLDPTDLFPREAQAPGFGDDDDEPTAVLGRASPEAPINSPFDDDERTAVLGTKPLPPLPKTPDFGDEDDEPTRALPTRNR